MKTKKVFLLLNGLPPSIVPNISNYDVICATDGAYQYLKENNIKPDFISGDFDSLETIPNNFEVIRTPNQDFTDFDKTLQILFDKGYRSVRTNSILKNTYVYSIYSKGKIRENRINRNFESEITDVKML